MINMMVSRRMRWVWIVARMGYTRNAYRILLRKAEEKRPLERQRCTWVDNIKMDLRVIAWDGINYMI
jgi:hypothetical protein